MFGRLSAWRERRAMKRRVRAVARTHTMVYLTENGPSFTAPLPPIARGRCHICGVGRFTARDPYSGVHCCDHCGAPADQMPGATPRDGAAASEEHMSGDCVASGCRSYGRPELDARERERAYL